MRGIVTLDFYGTDGTSRSIDVGGVVQDFCSRKYFCQLLKAFSGERGAQFGIGGDFGQDDSFKR